MSATVLFRVMSTGAPRRPSVELVRALSRMSLTWDIDFHFFKLFTGDPLNDIFATARASNYEFVIAVPDDIGVANVEALAALPSFNAPVVDGLVPVFNHGHLYWNAYHLTPDDVIFSVDDQQLRLLEQVYQTSLACACYRRDVVEAAKEFPFRPTLNADGTLADQGGYDVTFCRALHARDLPIYVSAELRPMHIRSVDLAAVVEAVRRGRPSIVRHLVDGRNFPRCSSYVRQWELGGIWRPPGI